MNDPFQLQNNICWRITKKCNRACEFCLSKSDRSFPHHIINYKTVLDRLKKIGVEKIAYAGGEPTLHPELGNMVKNGSNLGFSQVLTTNGDMFIREVPSWVNQLDYLRLSFYGLALKHDAIMGDGHYLKLLNLANALERTCGVSVAANIMLTTFSTNDLTIIFSDLRKNNIKQVLLLTYIPTGVSNIDDRYIGPEPIKLEEIKEVNHHYANCFPNGIKILNFARENFYVVLDEKNQLTIPGIARENAFVMGNVMDDRLRHPVLGITDAKSALRAIWKERDKIGAVIE